MNPSSPRATPASSKIIHMRCYTPCVMTRLATRIINPGRLLGAAMLAALLAACAAQPPVESAPVQACPAPAPCPACPVCPSVAPEPPKAKTLEAVGWADLPGWAEDDPQAAWQAFLRSCTRLKAQAAWRASCARAEQLPATASVREFFESGFLPYRVANADGSVEGMVTGYYEPLLRGSRRKEGAYRYPLYAAPADLLIVDLSEVNPELKHLRLRGRLEGRRVVPYYPRADIERGLPGLTGKELLWVDDPVDLFFLQIQGSGRVRLASGELVRVGYADQNGQPYKSIGRYLVEQGELKLEQASMQGIKAWGTANPAKLDPWGRVPAGRCCETASLPHASGVGWGRSGRPSRHEQRSWSTRLGPPRAGR